MQAAQRFALTAVPIAAIAALWMFRVETARSSTEREEQGGAESIVEDPALARIARHGEAGDAPADLAVDLPSEQARRRVDAGVPEEAGPDPQAPAVAPVMGVVVDARGVPIPGVGVELAPGLENPVLVDSTDGNGNTIILISGAVKAEHLVSARTRTDARGGFVFEGSDRSEGGTLLYGRGYLLGAPHEAYIDKEVVHQVLRVPDSEAQDSVWEVTVTDLEGDPVPIDEVELQFLGGATAPGARRPQPHERIVQPGVVEQRGLPPGRWRMTVASRSSLRASTDAEIALGARQQRFESALTLATYPDGSASDVAASPEEDGTLWVDPGSGLLDWLPKDRLRVGQNRMDRHFAHTLRVGHGPVQAAQLTLVLEASSGMSRNDAIYLEHTGPRAFAWAGQIASLTGGRWNRGDRRTVRLDLTRLPDSGDGPVDLRPFLEDGRLDVVIQDDTVVHDLSLRIIR